MPAVIEIFRKLSIVDFGEKDTNALSNNSFKISNVFSLFTTLLFTRLTYFIIALNVYLREVVKQICQNFLACILTKE